MMVIRRGKTSKLPFLSAKCDSTKRHELMRGKVVNSF